MSFKQVIIQQITNFINELNSIFPENKDLMIFKEKYEMLKSINSQLILDHLIQFIYPFKQRIVSQDDTFFLEGGGQDEIKKSKFIGSAGKKVQVL